MEKVAFSYESKIDSILDGDFIIFKEEDKKAILEFESSYLSKFTDIEEEDIENFRTALQEIKKSIYNDEHRVDKYIENDRFVHFGAIRLFSNYFSLIEKNSIFIISKEIGIIDSKIDFTLVQNSIKELLYSTYYRRKELIEMRKIDKDKIVNELENENNKKFLNYIVPSLKATIENTFYKMFKLNYFRLQDKIINSIDYSKENTFFGVFKDVFVNYLAGTYNLLEDKNNKSYALLLSFHDYLDDEILKKIKKLSETVNKNIIVGKTTIEEVREQSFQGLKIVNKENSEIYKTYLTNDTPKHNDRYLLVIGNSNLAEGYKLEYNKEVLDIKLKSESSTIRNYDILSGI